MYIIQQEGRCTHLSLRTMCPTELQAVSGGEHPLSSAPRWARDMAAMPRGSVTTMYGCHLCRRCHRRCSEMPSGGRRVDQILLLLVLQEELRDLRRLAGVDPASITPCLRGRRVLSAPHATISTGDDRRPSAPTSGPCQRPPPPLRRHSLRMPPSLPSSSVSVASFRCPPLPPALVCALWGVQRIDHRCRKRASVIAFFSAPAVFGGPVVAVAAATSPVLIGVAAVEAREAPTPAPSPAPCSRGRSRHPTAKPGASLSSPTPMPPCSFYSLLPLPSPQWMALANSMCTFFGRTASITVKPRGPLIARPQRGTSRTTTVGAAMPPRSARPS